MVRSYLRSAKRRFMGWRLDHGLLRIATPTLNSSMLPLYLRQLFRKYDIDCVVDVGANLGQFAFGLRSKVDYRGPILSFEPASEAFAKLERLSRRETGIYPFQYGLGTTSETLRLNVMEKDVLASFLDPAESGYDVGQSRIVKTQEVPVRRLDDLSGEIPLLGSSRRMLLKIDTQGFDLQVLEGARGVLDRVVALLIETPMAQIYDGAPGFFDVLDAAREQGFHPAAFAPSFLAEDRIIDVDILFMNADFAK